MKLRYLIFLLVAFRLFAVGQHLDQPTRRYLKTKMDSIGREDQKYRWHISFGTADSRKVDSLKKLSYKNQRRHLAKAAHGESGLKDKQRDSLWILQKRVDSGNCELLFCIIDRYGYPDYKRTGSYTTASLSLHFMGDRYFKKLLPIFTSEVQKGNMAAEEFAAWYDRNKLIKKEKQLYGAYNSQFPCVEDLEKSNLERKKIGLKPLKKNKCRSTGKS